MTTVECDIAGASPVDARAIATLCSELGYVVAAGDVSSRLDDLLHDEDHAVLVARAAGDIVGWVHVYRTLFLEMPACAEIGGIVVGSAARRSGVGRALMEVAEAWARERGLAAVTLRSTIGRPEAHSFYPSIGYTLLKTQHCYAKPLKGDASQFAPVSGERS